MLVLKIDRSVMWSIQDVPLSRTWLLFKGYPQFWIESDKVQNAAGNA
jgi:hypothetical protein